MPLTTAQLAVLLTELETDPRAYGYAPLIASGSDGGLAAAVNLVRAAISVKRADCAPNEILEAIDVRDFIASPAGTSNASLTAAWFESVCQFARIRLTNVDGTKTQIRKNIDRMVGDTNLSQTRLDAVAIRSGSRSEELFGVGVVVSVNDIAAAFGRV